MAPGSNEGPSPVSIRTSPDLRRDFTFLAQLDHVAPAASIAVFGTLGISVRPQASKSACRRRPGRHDRGELSRTLSRGNWPGAHAMATAKLVSGTWLLIDRLRELIAMQDVVFRNTANYRR
jgi:hypothetical protein